MGQMQVLVNHYLPGQPVTAETYGRALWLEKRHFETLAAAVASGIGKVL